MDAGQADGPGEGRVDVGQRVDFWEEQGSTALKGSDESLTFRGPQCPRYSASLSLSFVLSIS